MEGVGVEKKEENRANRKRFTEGLICYEIYLKCGSGLNLG